MRKSLYRELKIRINALPKGTVMCVTDFSDFAKPKTVSKMLTRIQEEGKIEKVLRSIFWKPDGSASPQPDDVANALARENNWQTAPSNETALHLFGLEEKSPEVWTYITDGTSRMYVYAEHKITFTHAAMKGLGAMAKKTRVLVQCIRAYGKEHLSDDLIRKLKKKISGWDTRKLKDETKNAVAWVRKAVGHLCKEPAEAVK